MTKSPMPGAAMLAPAVKMMREHGVAKYRAQLTK